jgi:hypothetical protein
MRECPGLISVIFDITNTTISNRLYKLLSVIVSSEIGYGFATDSEDIGLCTMLCFSLYQ